MDYIGSYAWTVLKPIVSIVRSHIHEFILIFVAWEHLLFSNSVQRSWLYPPQLTLQVRVASIRRDFNCKVIALQRWDSNPRLRWRCRYVKSQTKLFPWDQGYIELGRQSGWLTNNHAAYSQEPTKLGQTVARTSAATLPRYGKCTLYSSVMKYSSSSMAS